MSTPNDLTSRLVHAPQARPVVSPRDASGDTLGDAMPPPARPSFPRVRVVGGGDGRQWVVRELSPPVTDRRGTNSLVFATESLIRRVRNYPHDWYDCSDDELLALSRHA